MTAHRVERAAAIAAELTAAGVAATHDPGKVAALAPCVLVVPPRLTFDLNVGATAEWSLYAIAGRTVADLQTWRQLDGLVDQVAALLPLTAGEPASYAPAAGADPTPAYRLTYTESVD